MHFYTDFYRCPSHSFVINTISFHSYHLEAVKKSISMRTFERDISIVLSFFQCIIC